VKKLTRKEIDEKLLFKNPSYKKGDFQIIGDYDTKTRTIRTQNRYGECLVHLSNLMAGNSPTIKTAINKTEYWINMVLEKRCCDYDYSEVTYIDNNTKVKIFCNKHQKYFNQAPYAHLVGQGCPYCSKERNEKTTYKKYDEAYFYVLRCYNQIENFIKIGNTVGSLRVRYDSKRKMPYTYEVVENIFCSIDEVMNIESRLKSSLIEFKYKPNINFSGSATEVFEVKSLPFIIQELKEFKCK
jgi:hypothetical protein